MTGVALWQEACRYAASAHHGQLRKDGITPYVTHPFRVALTVRAVFGCEGDDVLAAALLHDTIEDTQADYHDLQSRFGTTVADWVAQLTKDDRYPKGERQRRYFNVLADAPWQVKVIKLADSFDNLSDSVHLSPEGRAKQLRKAGELLERIGVPDAPEPLHRAVGVLRSMIATMTGQEPT